MLESHHRRSTTDPDEQSTPTTRRPDTTVVTETTPFRIGRLVYGGILAMMAVDGLRNAGERARAAAANGVPMPRLATNLSHGLLLAGGVGISLWRAPALAASAVATFLLGVTPTMHDFWNADDPKQKQEQTTHFLKNAALLGTALVLLGVAVGGE